MRDNLWYAFQLDNGFNVNDLVMESIGYFDAYIEKFGMAPTHIAVHKDTPDEVIQALEYSLPINVCTSPPMAYPTWFSIGVRDIHTKLRVESSSIHDVHFVEYETEDESASEQLGSLRISFKNAQLDGGSYEVTVYEYTDVPKEVWFRLLEAASKGVFFNEHIRDKYISYKLEEQDAQEAQSTG